MTTSRTQRTARIPTAPGRFVRPGTGTAGTRPGPSHVPRRPRSGRRAQPPRHGIAGGWLQRSQPQQPRIKKALGRATSVLPAMTRRRSSAPARQRGTKAGGMALLAGAVGLAFTNREKLTSMLRGKKPDQSGAMTSAPAAGATSPATPTTDGPSATDASGTRPTSAGDDAA